jgi:adenylosuccinate lyase
VPYFGYDNLYRPVVEVELVTLEVLSEIGVIPAEDMILLTPEKREQVLSIVTTEVDKVEREVTRHDIRALVRLIQEILGPRLGRWVHIPLTSYDALATARSLQFVRAHKEAVRPSIKKVAAIFIEKIRETADIVQIGRTHGQHALPVTVGFWLATILDRIMNNVLEADYYADAIEGKISGAVGAHNAQLALGFSDRCDLESFENRVLKKLDLEPALISTQILPPEGLIYYLFSCLMLTGAFGQFGRDGRHLMRSEIAEVGEEFEEGQVGSSTMANKRNPVNFEGIESMHVRTIAEFLKPLLTLISEHQRDLVGSSVARDFPIIVVNLQQQLNILLRKNKAGVPWLERVTFNYDALRRNFQMSSDVILAEPLYIALQMADYEEDAHELVNHTLMPIAQSRKMSLVQALNLFADSDKKAKKALDRIPPETLTLLNTPENYVGDASEKALAVVEKAEEYWSSNP